MKLTIPIGLCQCGCRQITKIAARTDMGRSWKKGEPFRFIFGHRFRKLTNYKKIGFIREHVLIGERALGKLLPRGVVMHHFPSNGNSTHLVICQDHAYHMLLHVRHRSFIACGDPNWRKCQYCNEYDDQNNLYVHKDAAGRMHYRHRSCWNAYQRERRSWREERICA